MQLSIDDYLQFSRAIVYLSLVVYSLTIIFAIAAQVLRERRLVLCARQSMFAGCVLVVTAAAGLVAGFIRGEYHIDYIFNYSERGLPLFYKFTGLWAGLNGSLLFWSMLIAILSCIVAWHFRKEQEHPVGRRLEPNVYMVFALVQVFFLYVVAFLANPFWELIEKLGPEHFHAMFPNGLVADGAGLNPLLQNYWMTIHPPCLYAGWTAYTVPFAFGVAALITGEQGKYWIRKVRRWTLVAWIFNTVGILLGGLWAYVVLGWGGVWAWDPVENASFLPWLIATAFLHSIIVQERRNMLRTWNALLVCLTFLASIFGTYLTRSGIVSSVHAFASGSVGDWFFGFLMVLLLGSMVLVCFRLSTLRSNHKIQSFLSREMFFVLNNTVLLVMAFVLLLFTLYPKISNDWFGDPVTLSVPVYNQVFTPLIILMLFLTAIGPQLAWIKTSKANLMRNLLIPFVVALPLTVGLVYYVKSIQASGEPFSLFALDPGGPGGVAGVIHELIYRGWLVYLASVYVMTTLGFEVLRTTQNRVSRRKEPWGVAFVALTIQNHRRYGGYMVHVGLALVAISMVSFGVYGESRQIKLQKGDVAEIGPYQVRMEDFLADRQGVREDHGTYVYDRHRIELSVSKAGVALGSMHPEKRFYPVRTGRPEPQTATEVQIMRTLREDFYVFFEATAQNGVYEFTFYRNPLFWVILAGLGAMLGGGLWAAIPMGRRRVGLAD